MRDSTELAKPHYSVVVRHLLWISGTMTSTRLRDGVIVALMLTMMVAFMPSVRAHHQDFFGVSYEEIVQLGASCYPRDTCQVTRRADILAWNMCQCGRICSRLGTCCVDSKFKNVPRDTHMMPEHCRPQHHRFSRRAFMIDGCPSHWNGEDRVTQLCLGDGEKMNDPLMLIPATNPQHRVTYKNIFCATCNGEDLEQVVSWNLYAFVRTENNYRNVTQPELENMRFRYTRYWEIEETGEEVRLQMEIPQKIKRYVYECPKTEIIHTCAHNWTDLLTAQKCSSYMGIVVSNKIRYRNVHCALCNFRTIESLSCKVSTVADPGDYEKIPFSFGLLLDVNPNDGSDLVGKRKICKRNQIFHPTRGQCITLRGCLTGFRLFRGRCVRE